MPKLYKTVKKVRNHSGDGNGGGWAILMDSWSASRALADSWSVWASKAKLQQDKRRAERGTLSLAHVDGEQRRGPDGCRGRLSENTSMGTAPFVPSDWCNPLAIAAGMLQDFCEIKIRAQEMLAVLNTMLNHSLSVSHVFFLSMPTANTRGLRWI